MSALRFLGNHRNIFIFVSKFLNNILGHVWQGSFPVSAPPEKPYQTFYLKSCFSNEKLTLSKQLRLLSRSPSEEALPNTPLAAYINPITRGGWALVPMNRQFVVGGGRVETAGALRHISRL